MRIRPWWQRAPEATGRTDRRTPHAKPGPAPTLRPGPLRRLGGASPEASAHGPPERRVISQKRIKRLVFLAPSATPSHIQLSGSLCGRRLSVKACPLVLEVVTPPPASRHRPQLKPFGKKIRVRPLPTPLP